MLVSDVQASDSDWHKIVTPHFELFTDLDTDTAVEAAKELETTRDALITAAWPAFAFPDVVRTQVFVLSNGLDFERLFGRRTWGLFVSGTRPAFYLYGPPSKWAPRATLLQAAPSSVLRHEMTHQLAAAVFPRTPRWFSEGLAQFLETVQITSDGKSIVVGSTNRDGRAKFYADRTVTVKRTLEWHESIHDLAESEVHGLYGTSWALFHWLYNNRQDAFSRYQLALAKGVNAKSAWDAAFPAFNPEAYDPLLYEYLRNGRGAVDTLPLRTTTPTIDVKPMNAAAGRATRARIALTSASGLDEDARKTRLNEVTADLKKALELDATCVEALVLTTRMTSDGLLKAARAAAEAHPDDSRIHAFLGDILNERDEREAAYRRALQIDPEDPQILDSLAKLLVTLRRADEAFPLALRAVQRAPHDFNVIQTFAETLFQRGRCQDAVRQQQRAADRAKEVGARATSSIVQKLKAMKAECEASGQLLPEPDAAAVLNAMNDAAEPASTPVDEPKIQRPHYEGVYAAANIGLGYGTGTFESIRGATGSGSFDGGAIDVGGALGYAPIPGFVVALEAGVFSHPAFSEQVNFSTGAFVTDVTVTRIGVLADVHPGRSALFHLQAGLDFARASWSGATGLYSEPQLPIDEASIGFLAHAGGGLFWRVHHYEMGPSLRVHYSGLRSESINASLFGVTAFLGFYL